MITVDRSDSPGPDRTDATAGPTGADPDSLSDEDLRSEIELVADLVVAASGQDEPLSRSEIDRILGVEPA